MSKWLLALSLFFYLLAFQTFAFDLNSAERQSLTLKSVKSQDSERDRILYPANAIPAFVKLKLDRKLNYLTGSEDLSKLSPPPVNSSARAQAELKYLLDLQSKRTPKISEEVLFYDRLIEANPPDFQSDKNDLRGPFIVGKTLGKKFNRMNLPKTRQLLNNAVRDMETICYKVKFKFNRARPHQLDAKILSALSQGVVPPHPAYPAGHSCIGYGAAEILSDLAPTRQTQFFDEADRMAASREWAGIHFPSDSESSKQLVHILFQVMKKNSQFLLELREAQDEIKKLL